MHPSARSFLRDGKELLRCKLTCIIKWPRCAGNLPLTAHSGVDSRGFKGYCCAVSPRPMHVSQYLRRRHRFIPLDSDFPPVHHITKTLQSPWRTRRAPPGIHAWRSQPTTPLTHTPEPLHHTQTRTPTLLFVQRHSQRSRPWAMRLKPWSSAAFSGPRTRTLLDM
jgi:hypothetical protein